MSCSKKYSEDIRLENYSSYTKGYDSNTAPQEVWKPYIYPPRPPGQGGWPLAFTHPSNVQKYVTSEAPSKSVSEPYTLDYTSLRNVWKVSDKERYYATLETMDKQVHPKNSLIGPYIQEDFKYKSLKQVGEPSDQPKNTLIPLYSKSAF